MCDDLTAEMRRLDMILDATHLCDDSFAEAMELFDGPVWASHSNCRALVPHDRQFTDEQLRELIGRGAVIGAALDAWMLAPGWIRGQTTPQSAGVRQAQLPMHANRSREAPRARRLRDRANSIGPEFYSLCLL